jgi:hypothetical protein
MSHDVFISYSSHDKAAADAACLALEAAGIRCWIAPRDITPGAEWGEAIVEAITHCHGLVLIFSEHANNSPQIRREVERAVSKGIPIIPLRIQDIAPTRSLEFFIGTVHWLDALTPPLEAHLRHLVTSVKALPEIVPTPPRIVPPPAPSPRPGNRALIPAIAAAILAACLGGWWFASSTHPAPVPPTSPPASHNTIDPALIGTFTHDAVLDDYDWHFILSIAASGTYHLVITQEENGTYSSGNGAYSTTGAKTGRVRTGTYRAISNSAIAVTSATGTVVFHPSPPTAPLDQSNPIMLGLWQASVTQNGLTWNLTLQNNPDHTYKYVARAEDSGSCTYAAGQWHALSAITGQSSMGTYQVIGVGDVEITGPAGPAVWHRQ